MIDINKGISDVEASIGRSLTDDEKRMTTLFGEFMNMFWRNHPEEYISPPPPIREERSDMEIGEVIDGLDYCLSTGKCIGCEYSEGRMVVTCRPLAENALRLLQGIH